MRILNRPMFRLGGSTGQGITSGLTPRKGYAQGSSTQERLLRAIGPRKTGVYDFLTDWGLRMASATPSGNVLQTAAKEAIDPYERFVKGKQGEENLLRQVALEGEGIDIKAEQSALAAKAEAELKRELLKTRGAQQKELYELEKGENLEALIQARAQESIADGKYGEYGTAKNEAEWTYRGSKKYTDRKVGGVLTIEQATPGKVQNRFAKKQGKKNGVGTVYFDPFGNKVLELAHVEGEYVLISIEGVSEDIVTEATPKKEKKSWFSRNVQPTEEYTYKAEDWSGKPKPPEDPIKTAEKDYEDMMKFWKWFSSPKGNVKKELLQKAKRPEPLR